MNVGARLVRLLRVEAQKALGGRMLKIGMLAVAAVTALTAWTHDSVDLETGWTVLATSLTAGLWAAEIFLLVAGTTAIAGETAQGTLKMILPHAYRRSDWIVAKALILAAQAAVLLAVATGVAYAFAKFGLGLGDVSTPPDEMTSKVFLLRSAAEMGGFFREILAVSLASLIATAWVGLLISCVFDSVVPALSTGFLVFLGVKSAGTLFGASEELLKKLYAWYPTDMLLKLYDLGRGISGNWYVDRLSAGLVRAGAVGVACVLIGTLVFSRRDLQS